jgi:hypothetical protein
MSSVHGSWSSQVIVVLTQRPFTHASDVQAVSSKHELSSFGV